MERKRTTLLLLIIGFPDGAGDMLPYGLSEGGDEMATLYVMDVDKKENLQDKIVHCRYSSVQWLPDDSGFFYTRNPRPCTVPKNEEHLHLKFIFIKSETIQTMTKLIFGRAGQKMT